MAEAFVQHLTLGGELLRADRVEEARVQLEKARDLKPEDGKVLGLLGLVYFRLNRFDEARGIFTDLGAKQPKDASVHLNLGLVLLKMGQVEGAIDALGKARDLDPGQSRTVGYLGLAYARAGKYKQAREAFLAAGQEELAREMEQYLGGSDGAADASSAPAAAVAETSKPVAAASPAPAASAAPPPVPSDSGSSPKRGKERAAATPAPAAAAPAAAGVDGVPQSVHEEPTAPADAAVMERMAGEGVVSAAVRIAALPSPALADIAADGQTGAPRSLGAFATARLISPDDGEMPFQIGPGEVLIVRVRGRVLTRTDGVVVSGGELAYEPATKRVRGRMTEEPFGSDTRPMFIVSGNGHLCASARGGHFAALELSDDVLYIKEELVFAFEERLRWENGHVPGSAGSVNVVQFRGEGCVVLRARRQPITVKLLPDKVLYVDAELLAGWIGRVVPRVVAPAAGGEASSPFVECSGEGMLIVEEPEAPSPDGR